MGCDPTVRVLTSHWALPSATATPVQLLIRLTPSVKLTDPLGDGPVRVPAMVAVKVTLSP